MVLVRTRFASAGHPRRRRAVSPATWSVRWQDARDASEALDAMATRGIAATSDVLAMQRAVREMDARRRRESSLLGLTPRQLTSDLYDLVVEMPRETPPALRALTRNNRLRTLGLAMLAAVVAAGLLSLPW